jgi:hypothetical protein
MEAETHPDPFREAMTHGLQRAMQVASFAGTAAQVYVYHQKTQARVAADQDERARRALQAQIRAERDAARAGWSPAMDAQWLLHADLHDTAQVWGAAMPYADRDVPWHEPTAAAAMRKSEQRLHDLHPFAMARYDRLRADGLGPAEAMRETAPLFALSPRARAWPFAPVPVLDAGTGAADGRAADRPAPGSEPDDFPGSEALESRGRSIVTALQERARAGSRDPLGDDELRTVLETVTNLPADVIDRVIRPGPADGGAQSELDGAAAPGRPRAADIDEVTGLKATLATDEGTETQSAAWDPPSATRAAADLPSRTTQPWQRDFPVPIHEVVAAAAGRPARTAAPRAAASRPAASRVARPGGPGHA